ncbi:KTSC domain-containing protein [Lysobacter enzymogenes]|uniref:KTSC domain-containing protein n=1 Tax=Lysobacter enzymogenes TaxID=69 RepID=UPI0019D23562|nr:KTSC domain-containing protein [Lysobacter enzymogenes]MBN7138962.1 KTSC domain-containing protein [Lysobacter enzymogenes]
MANIPMVEVESSQIHSIGHDPETNTLAVRFYRGFGRGKELGPLYHYENVSPDDFAQFRDAESKGRHFGRFIKPFSHKYPYTRVAA